MIFTLDNILQWIRKNQNMMSNGCSSSTYWVPTSNKPLSLLIVTCLLSQPEHLLIDTQPITTSNHGGHCLSFLLVRFRGSRKINWKLCSVLLSIGSCLPSLLPIMIFLFTLSKPSSRVNVEDRTVSWVKVSSNRFIFNLNLNRHFMWRLSSWNRYWKFRWYLSKGFLKE